jgi:hypothetical protein
MLAKVLAMSLPDHAYSHSIVNFLVDMFANPSS